MDASTNPWTVAAADVTGLAAVAGSGNNPGDVISVGGVFYLVVWRGRAHIYQVEFQFYAADTDICTIDQYNTKIFWYGNGASDLETVRSGNLGWCNGLLIPNSGITNGYVRIYHR
jgi:hypothetical protein